MNSIMIFCDFVQYIYELYGHYFNRSYACCQAWHLAFIPWRVFIYFINELHMIYYRQLPNNMKDVFL